MSTRAVCLLHVLLLTQAAAAAPRPAGTAQPAAPAGRLPTTGDVRESFDQGDYAQALRQASAALSAKGVPAAPDRYELLVLKGESFLRLKNNKEAAEAFDDAAGAAKDDPDAVLARSMAELSRRAKGLAYSPPAKKGEPAKTIDISVREQRPAAFAAMFEESRPKVAAAVKAARTSGKLPAMLDAFRTLFDLRALEIAGTGGDTQTGTIAADLTERAAAHMKRAVGDMSKTVDKLQEVAYRYFEQNAPGAGGFQPVASGLMGLDLDQAAQLRQILMDCNRIGAVAMDLKKLFPGDQADALRTIRDDADAVATRARALADVPWDQYRTGSGYAGADPNYGQQPQQAPPRGGTNRIQRTADPGNRAAGPRGVSTAGPR